MRTMVTYLQKQTILFLFLFFSTKHSFEVHIYSLCLAVPSIPELCNVENIPLKMSKSITPNSCLLQASVHFFPSLKVYSFMEQVSFKSFTVSKLTFKSHIKQQVKKRQMKAIKGFHLFCVKIKRQSASQYCMGEGRNERKNVFLNLGMILLD